MRIAKRVGVVSLGAVSAVAALLVAGAASAQGVPPPPPPPAAAPPAPPPPEAAVAPPPAAPPASAPPASSTPAPAAPTAATPAPTAPEHATGHDEHPTVDLGLDAVLGFGKLAVLAQPAATSANQLPPFGVARAKVFSASFLLGTSFEVARGFHLGARWPFSYASFKPENDPQSRGTSAAGNLELEAAYHHHIDPMTSLAAGLGIALPTAQGSPLPDARALGGDPQFVQQTDIDRRAVNRAAAASRGWEENALFTPHYLGLVPQVRFHFKVDQLHIDPWVKLEYLVRVAQKEVEEHSSIAELVFGARIAYDFTKELQGAIRAWGNVGFTSERNEDGTVSKPAAGVLEPQLRGQFGNVSPVVGVLIPFAGKGLTDPRWTGVRLGVTFGF